MLFQQSNVNNNSTNGSLLVTPPVERLHASASNPNLLNHLANHEAQASSKQDSPVSPGSQHESRIQDIRLRENFVSAAENG